MKPTKEEIKEFWEWCGFKYWINWGGAAITRPDGMSKGFSKHTVERVKYPKLDLRNLFKYAVPEYRKSLSMSGLFERWLYYMRKYGEAKPETTLFLVLNEARVIIEQEVKKLSDK